MKINVSCSFMRRRGDRSTSPTAISDFCEVVQEERDVEEVVKSGSLIVPYAFSKNLDVLCVTYHSKARDLLEGAFFYQRQFSTAERITVDSSAVLPCLVSGAAAASPVFLVSPGRVGSTLVSSALKQGGVECLSEPDAISGFKISAWKNAADEDRRRMEVLLYYTILLYQRVGNVIKLRSYSASIMPLIIKLFPRASFVFLFRDIESWAKSMLRAFRYNAADLVWVLEQNIEAYTMCMQSGSNAMVMGYDDFVRAPSDMLNRLAVFLGDDGFDISSAICALERDSQGGTGIDKRRLAKRTYQEGEMLAFRAAYASELSAKAKCVGLDEVMCVR